MIEEKMPEVQTKLDLTDEEMVKKVLGEVASQEARLGAMRAQYLKAEAETLANISKAVERRNSVLSMIRERMGFSEEWILDLDKMEFILRKSLEVVKD